MKLRDFLQDKITDEALQTILSVSIPDAIKQIRTALSNQRGEKAGTQNIHGEHQLALDVVANNIVCKVLEESRLVSLLASEEMEELKKTSHADAPFMVAFDPLDGSSLVDVNFAVGSIFGIYRWSQTQGNFLGNIKGKDQLAACYAVYGPHTTLVISVGGATHEFRLHEDGDFYLLRESIRIEPEAKYFAPGNLRAAAENPEYLAMVNDWIMRGLTLRYSGGMVPDINHIILKGNGIFTYPGFSKAPEGKLRLLFECNPMAFIVEAAGGRATDGKDDILEKPIIDLHQKTPIYIGSKVEVGNK